MSTIFQLKKKLKIAQKHEKKKSISREQRHIDKMMNQKALIM